MTVAVAYEWIGTPYAPGQSVKGVGCDCVGLILGFGKEIGAIPPEYFPEPYDASDREMLERELSKWCEPVEVAEAGDVVQLSVYSPEGPRPHCALLLGGDLIHVYGRKFGVTKHGFSQAWQRRAVAVWRWRSQAAC